jgi:hypothetical protein
VSYFLGNLLYFFPNFICLFYPFINKIFNFENKQSFILYIISIIVGNPTSTYLIINVLSNNDITFKEATRLLRFCSFISIFFIFFVLKPPFSIVIFIGQILSSIIISRKDRQKQQYAPINKEISIMHIIEKLPYVLLNILSTMLFTAIIKIPFNIFFKKSLFLVPTLLSFLEITSGIEKLSSLFTNIPFVFFSSMLISFHGIAIIIQVIILLKQKMLNINDYLKYRIIHSFQATLFSILFYLFINFFF